MSLSQNSGLTFIDDKRLALLDRSHHHRHSHPPIGLALSHDRDVSPLRHRLARRFHLHLGPAPFGTWTHASLASLEIDQTPAALGLVGFRRATHFRTINDQLGSGEELSQSGLSPEDALHPARQPFPPWYLLGRNPAVTQFNANRNRAESLTTRFASH